MFAKSPLLEISLIQSRLEAIFPEGLPDRGYVVRETAAKTIFVMLYIDAVVGNDIYLAPKQVYRMSTQQAEKQSDDDRVDYRIACMRPRYQPQGDRWYADNTREPIRDESLRDGLVVKGAVFVDQTVPTT